MTTEYTPEQIRLQASELIKSGFDTTAAMLRQGATAIERVREFEDASKSAMAGGEPETLTILADEGLRFDMNPTVHMMPMEKTHADYLSYIRRMNDRAKEIGQELREAWQARAVSSEGAVPVAWDIYDKGGYRFECSHTKMGADKYAAEGFRVEPLYTHPAAKDSTHIAGDKAEQGVPAWISVGERLPDADTVVLVAVRYAKFDRDEDGEVLSDTSATLMYAVTEGQYREGPHGGYLESFSGPHGDWADDITHWQPLPAPPNADNPTQGHIEPTPQRSNKELESLLTAANEKIARYESRLELVSYTDGNGVAHLMTEAEKIGMPDGIECRDETIGLLDEKIAQLKRALETHPCHTEGLEFDHNWKFVDDSFDHEYGTEVVHYFQCRFCEATKDVEGEGDCTIDG